MVKVMSALVSMVIMICLCVPAISAAKSPICRSKENPGLLSFRGNDQFKLIGYDYYDLLNTDQVSEGLEWRTEEDKSKNRPSYEPFFDMLAKNNVNFTRCFVWGGWGNDLFCWKRVSTEDDPIKSGVRYARVDLSQFEDKFWTRARKAIEYAAKKGVIVEVTLFDRCCVDSDSISPRRWSFHPFNPENSMPGTIGCDLGIPSGKERGMPYVYDIKNPKIKSLYEAYLKKWVESTRGLDNVVFEIENEGYSGYEFNNWVAKYLRNELKCKFLIGVNTFSEKDECHAIPEVDIIADHGEKSPREVGDLKAEWSKFKKVIMVDTDGWRSSEQSYEKALQVAQSALDLDMHFNHKARTNKPCGDTGKPFISLMSGVMKDTSKPSVYRLSETDSKQKILHIVMDEKNIENGLRQDPPWEGSGDGWTKVVEQDAKKGRSITPGPRGQKTRSIFFDVDDARIYKGGHPNVEIEVEFFDTTAGELVLEYDAKGDTPKTKNIKVNGVMDWQRARFTVDDAYFGNRCFENADFGIRRPDGSTIIISQAWVRML